MNIFENQNFRPMLLSEMEKPFNDPEYLFELKFDGIRALVFVEPNKIIIKNKKGDNINNRYPELLNIKNNIKKKVIFDGEIILMLNKKPDFEKLKERALLKNNLKIKYYVKNFPVIFIAFDILYENNDLTNIPLIERKKILDKYKDTEYFVKTKYFDEYGKDLFKIVVKNKLEGIIAKRKQSSYQLSKRSSDWIKIKNFQENDYFICAYKEEDNKAVASLLLGIKENDKIKYVGNITIGRKNLDFSIIKKTPIDHNINLKQKGFTYIIPKLKCRVEYMQKSKNEKLIHAKYKGLIS